MNPLQILDLLKEVVAVAKKFNDLEFKKKIADLQDEVFALMSQLTEKDDVIADTKAQIKNLEEKLAFKAKLVRADGAYYEADENGNPKGDPYCTRCWEVERKAVTMYQFPEGMLPSMGCCPECHAKPRWPGQR